MKEDKVIYMSDRGTSVLNDYPDLKNRLPLIDGGITVISMAFVKSLQDQEFAVFVGLPCDFRVNKKTLQYIGDRMMELGIPHKKGVKEPSIQSN